MCFIISPRGNTQAAMGERPVNVVRTIWASVQGDPVFMRRINGWLTCFWIVMIPVSIATGWVHSVTYVSALLLWALVSGHWSTWQAARVEVTQHQEEAERENNPVEQRVVDALTEQTDIATQRPETRGEVPLPLSN